MNKKTHKPFAKIYKNGGVARLHNKSIKFFKMNGNVTIQTDNFDNEPNVPATIHECIRGKVRRTTIKFSEESFESLIKIYTIHKQKTQ